MNKKKKIIAAIAILLAICALFIGGHTYAKYKTEIRAVANGKIASWVFKVNGTDESAQQKIDLGQTTNEKTLVNGKIAPGTKGKFNIKIDATGAEVGVKYDITSTSQSNQPSNFYYIYDDVRYDNLPELLSKLSGNIYLDDETKVRNFEIQWEWPYETGNTTAEKQEGDRLDNVSQSSKQFQFDLVVTGTQINPNEG